MSSFGREIALDPRLSFLESKLIWLMGAPIIGMRIRAMNILPVVHSLKFSSVLDAACGRGAFSFYLARTNPDAQIWGLIWMKSK